MKNIIKTAEPKVAEKKQYKGIVNSPFKIGKKQYKINDEYKTSFKQSYDTLINSKRIK